MALDAKYVQIREKILAGIQRGVEKVVEDSIKNNTPIAISDGKGGVQLVYPAKKQ